MRRSSAKYASLVLFITVHSFDLMITAPCDRWWNRYCRWRSDIRLQRLHRCGRPAILFPTARLAVHTFVIGAALSASVWLDPHLGIDNPMMRRTIYAYNNDPSADAWPYGCTPGS